MKRIYKVSARILAFLLALALLMPFSLITKADTGDEYEGKIVILHSNDVHGAIDGYNWLFVQCVTADAFDIQIHSDFFVLIPDNSDVARGLYRSKGVG